ncbi:hypothetical protein CEXT_272501 [Caerostris extrusa]|uniref:Reverse transcriptase n=1 Tax=Caerostris extrusa TaxID=172846 RepID=A0AAV4XCW7_CAEEX|nr:hypothetical protein CEXT_272501 [Caerostris extrusa]
MTKKKPGPDNIFPDFLKHLSQVAKNTALTIFKSFWSKNINLPSDWVKPIVISIYKKDKAASDFASYRPNSLTSQLAKTFERMLTTRLNYILETHEILEED